MTVAETELPGAHDAITVPVAHSLMLVSPTIARQAECFLRTGRFVR